MNRSSNLSQLSDEESGQVSVLTVGATLPILVNEALRFPENRGKATGVGFRDKGWMVMVLGRSLFIWRSSDQSQQLLSRGQLCRELTLPVTDLAHKVDLVALYFSGKHESVGCLVASPEGLLFYWPSVNTPASCCEHPINLRGEQCANLKHIYKNTFLLSTVAGSLYVIQCLPDKISCCRPLIKTKGYLTGFSKRISSLFYSPIGGAEFAALNSGTFQVNYDQNTNSADIYLLNCSASVLEHWKLGFSDPGNPTETHVADVNLQKLLRHKISHRELFAHNLSINVVDISVSPRSTDLWVFCTYVVETEYQSSAPQYLLARLSAVTCTDVLSFLLISQHNLPDTCAQYSVSLAYGIISSPLVCVYNSTSLSAIDAQSGDLHQKLLFTQIGDQLLGIDFSEADGLRFFTRKHGVATLRSKHANYVYSRSTSKQSTKTPLPSQSSISLTEPPSGPKSRLIQAFINFMNYPSGPNQMRQNLQALQSELTRERELDEVVVSFGKDILNNMPSSDPRWSEVEISSRDFPLVSRSVIIENQIEEKRTWLHQYILFLKDSQLLGSLTAVRSSDRWQLTVAHLYNLLEMIVAAKSIRSSHLNLHPALLDEIITSIVKDRTNDMSTTLTVSDIFYREVTKISSVIQEASKLADTYLRSNEFTARKISEYFLQTAQVFSVLAKDILSHRKHSPKIDLPDEMDNQDIDLVSWLTDDSAGSSLVRFTELAMKQVGQVISDPSVRSELLGYVCDICDLILHSYQSVNTNEEQGSRNKFASVRTSLLFQLLENCEAVDKAIQLAEKYHEYKLLAHVCEKKGMKEQLKRYSQRFPDFTQFLMQYYLHQGKKGKLVGLAKCDDHLTTREETKSLSWLHHISTGSFRQAAECLGTLGIQETRLVDRKKTLLSLTKLAYLASGETHDSPSVIAINKELELVEYQKCLDSEDSLSQLDSQVSETPVYSADQLITRFSSCDKATEFDFKRALDLLQFINDESEVKQLAVTVWARVLITDYLSVQSPQFGQRGMTHDSGGVFTRLVELLCSENTFDTARPPDIQKIMTSCEITGDLRSDAQFEFYIRALYEKVLSA